MADPFTQKLLERTRARAEYLKSKTSSSNTASFADSGSVAETKARSPLKEASGFHDAKFSQTSPKKPAVTATSFNNELGSGKENGQTTDNCDKQTEVRTKSKLKELGSLYGSEDRGSDVSFPTASTQTISDEPSKPFDSSRRARLAALAGRINDWQDESDLSPPKSRIVSSTPVKDASKYGQKMQVSANTAGSPMKAKYGTAAGFQAAKVVGTPAMKVAASSVEKAVDIPARSEDSKKKETTPKPLVLDNAVLASLEAQGYTPSSSRRSRLVYEFEKEQKAKVDSDSEESEPEESRDECAKSWSYLPSRTPKTSNSNLNAFSRVSPTKTVEKQPARSPQKEAVVTKHATTSMGSPVRGVQTSPKKSPQKVATPSQAMSVAQRAALFESATPVQPKKDPAELTLTERKALFEKNKGRPPMPPTSIVGVKTPVAPVTPARSAPIATPVSRSEVHNRFKQQALSAEQNANSAKAERMKELDMLLKRYDHQKKSDHHEEEEEIVRAPSTSRSTEPVKQASAAIPIAPPLPAVVGVSPKKQPITPQKSISPSKYPSVEDCKKIRVSPPKPGMLYPCLSDIEMTTETEADCSTASDNSNNNSQADDNAADTSQDLDSSFTVDILGRAGLSQFINTPKKRLLEMKSTPAPQASSASLRSIAERSDSDNDSYEVGGDISELLDEALENDTIDEPTPPKQTKMSKIPDTVIDGGREVPLFHSVSFYRKQKQQENSATPVKQVIRKVEVAASYEEEQKKTSVTQQVPVHQQIRALQEEINAQQIVISQASQALNLCRATAEFYGSTEQVEGERLLLVATQKRQAAINEIQRLKNEAALSKTNGDANIATAKGTLSISNLGLPLKKEYLSMLAKGGDDFVHYFLIIVKSHGQVVPTQMLSTIDGIQDGALRFPNLIQLRDLRADFNVAVEVYALQTRREKLPHDAKYHIRKESSRMKLTPKKLISKQESRLLSKPSIESPGGPTAVRSSSFGVVGFTSITPATIRRKQWTLEKVPFASPLTGEFNVRIQCHTDSFIEERGFLTMFEDVSGFGAWHRRWCVLSNDRISYWKYPDDEKRKEALGHVGLRSCITETVGQVSRDICARPNTFLLVTVRSQKPEDKDSLVMTCYPHRTALRHLISADSKEERQLWCNQINKALANLRAWDPHAQEPSSDGAVPHAK